MRSIDAALLLLLAASACGGPVEDEPRTRCRDRWIGSPDGEPAIALDARGPVGESIDREVLPDGSSGLLLSIRGRNLEGCAVAFAVRLSAEDGGEVRAGSFVELDEGGDGWGVPFWDTGFGHVAIPVSAGAQQVTVVVEDATGRRAVLHRSLTVR